MTPTGCSRTLRIWSQTSSERKVRKLDILAALDEPTAMTDLRQPGSLTLLRLILELKGSDLPSNAVFLSAISEREASVLAAELEDLERNGLVQWTAAADQWTPTMAGLALAVALPAFVPDAVGDVGICAA